MDGSGLQPGRPTLSWTTYLIAVLVIALIVWIVFSSL
jgi:hypothetical protein